MIGFKYENNGLNDKQLVELNEFLVVKIKEIEKFFNFNKNINITINFTCSFEI